MSVMVFAAVSLAFLTGWGIGFSRGLRQGAQYGYEAFKQNYRASLGRSSEYKND